MSEQVTDIRFGGIKRLYGQQQFEWLQQAHFCVVGIGGVGSWTAEALARTGVGKITLIDLDDICATNVNRQIHALTGTIGEAKVDAMKAYGGEVIVSPSGVSPDHPDHYQMIENRLCAENPGTYYGEAVQAEVS